MVPRLFRHRIVQVRDGGSAEQVQLRIVHCVVDVLGPFLFPILLTVVKIRQGRHELSIIHRKKYSHLVLDHRQGVESHDRR